MKILSKWVGAVRPGAARPGPGWAVYTSMATMNRVSVAMIQAVANM